MDIADSERRIKETPVVPPDETKDRDQRYSRCRIEVGERRKNGVLLSFHGGSEFGSVTSFDNEAFCPPPTESFDLPFDGAGVVLGINDVHT